MADAEPSSFVETIALGNLYSPVAQAFPQNNSGISPQKVVNFAKTAHPIPSQDDLAAAYCRFDNTILRTLPPVATRA